MRKNLILLGMLLICLILQYTLMPALAIAQVAPNLMLCFVVSFGLMRGNRAGMVLGFIAGILTDSMYMVLGYYVFGYHALIYMLMGYLCGYCYRIFYDDDVKMPVVMTAAADFIYGMIVYITQFLLRGRINFFFYLKRFILPEMIYTILITLVLYRFFLFLNRKLEKLSKRSVDSFV